MFTILIIWVSPSVLILAYCLFRWFVLGERHEQLLKPDIARLIAYRQKQRLKQNAIALHPLAEQPLPRKGA